MRTIDLNEVVLVYGDSDVVDGVTTINVIVNTIRFLGGWGCTMVCL